VRLREEVQELSRGVVGNRLAGRASLMNEVLVVAGALYDGEGRVLIAQRPAGKHMAGRWEFPGGKVTAGESEERALARELREELGVEVTASQPLMRLTHEYDDRRVELSLWIVQGYSGDPQSLDGQSLKWVRPDLLPEEDILEADRPFVEALQKRQRTR
jgi:8-oxo-dGTP diphosphatase